MENSDYDLKTYIVKYGSLPVEQLLSLIETLIGSNYYLQKDMNLVHGDIRPQSIRIIMNDIPQTNKQEPVFKLSYFDDTSSTNQQSGRLSSYMAPELLCYSSINSNFKYQPSLELQSLIDECPDEIRYDPSRADVFSAGLIAYSAITGIFFTLFGSNSSSEIIRNGIKEVEMVNQRLKALKLETKCEGLTEILRVMLNQNPLQRYDFEELAIRMNKVSEKSRQIPKVNLIRDDPQQVQELELLKQSYWQLLEMADELKEKEHEYKSTIEKLKSELERTSTPKSYSQANNDQHISPSNLHDISEIAINKDDSFLSMTSTNKLLVLDIVEVQKKNATPDKINILKERTPTVLTKKDSNEKTLKELKKNENLAYKEMKEGIFKRQLEIK
jgi:hypothetical protein